MHPLAQAAATLLGDTVTQAEPLQGGDLSDVLRMDLASGRTVIAKGGPAPETEADMLRAIAATGATAPAVLAADARVLVLESLPDTGRLSPRAWADLAGQLHLLHSSTGQRYGWDTDYALGRVPVHNTWQDNWPDFWANQRLLPELPHLPIRLAGNIAAVTEDLAEWLPLHPPASLLHGDLWAGNVLADGSSITGLIDPACYFGHAEVDLAMLSLFGSPPREFWERYGALTPGWPRRQAIYQLWPAIVHLRLFGAGYEALVSRLLSRITDDTS
ncbi:fructosamine kinase family protein [Marimonas lutisalis]|uniref:fructosamine kinase family protein n=1 Tax=Marimonas lutisalis TaxID=2545756 RepID=UPI0010F6D6EF|nr:fructosamine kinase family protein [Marimonas lutisalis]